jgi:phosphatidylglycerol lysyltransferase
MVNTDRKPTRWAHLRANLLPALRLLVFGVALVTLDHIIRQYPLKDIARALHAVPVTAVLASLGLTILGYLSLIGYDVVAFRILQLRVPLRSMIVPSFVTFAVSNTAPASVVSGGGVRYRMYRSSHHFTAGTAAKVAGLNVVTYAIGLMALSGLALVLHPEALRTFSPGASRWLGAALVAGVAFYLGLTAVVRSPVRILGRRFQVPPLPLALAQLGVSIADWLFSAGALYVLMAAQVPVPLVVFLATFLVGQAAALVVPVPGGLGVFEAVVLLLLHGGAGAPAVLAALLVYRVVYYLLPFLTAGGLLLARGVRTEAAKRRPVESMAGRLADLTPHLVSYTTFLGGLLLLGTGATSPRPERLTWLTRILPDAVILASHFMTSVIGAVLVLLAWGLERRVQLAYRVVRIMFGLGIAVTLLRSFDLRLAGILGLFFGILLLAGRGYRRPAATLRKPIGAGWAFLFGAIFLLNLWVGAINLRHAEYTGQTWWRFALFGNAPAPLRAAVGVAIVMLLFAMARVLAWRSPAPRQP